MKRKNQNKCYRTRAVTLIIVRLFRKLGIQEPGTNAENAWNAGNVHYDSGESLREFRGMFSL